MCSVNNACSLYIVQVGTRMYSVYSPYNYFIILYTILTVLVKNYLHISIN